MEPGLIQHLISPGSQLGLWDVVVTNPGGTVFRLPAGFTIEEGRAAKLWVDVIGRDTARPGLAQRFTILVGNEGNINSEVLLLIIAGIPLDANVTIDFDYIAKPTQTNTLDPPESPIVSLIDEKIIPLHIKTISAGTSESLPMRIFPSSESYEIKVFMQTPGTAR